MNMDTVPKITQAHVDKACDQLHRARVNDCLQMKNVDICNKAIEIALAEQSAQQETYITAEQARELGAGNVEFENFAGHFAKVDEIRGVEYQLHPKQPTWTGSRDDVIALLKELGVLCT
jgi:hypothetical protein